MASNMSAAANLPSPMATFSHYAFPIPKGFSFLGDKSLTWLYTTAVIVVSLLLVEQWLWRYRKGSLPGDKWMIPIIGKFADSTRPSMQAYQKQWDMGALSATSVFNIFIVMAANNEFSRKILNSPMYAEPALVHAAKLVLRSDNWVFLNGKAHVEYRRGLNALFTRKALGAYLTVQEQIARKHLTRWLAESQANPGPRPIMMDMRYCNMDTSLRVFCGDHIPEEAVKDINEKYWHITKSLELVNFPLPFPGTKVWYAVQARKSALRWLELAAEKSRIAMAAGGEPECMLDQWIRAFTDDSYKGRKDFTNLEMAMVLFSFLFASQDAMSSGLVYGFQHLVDNPDILAKVREEQTRVRQGNFDKPLTLDMIAEMTYLQAVVKESLRLKSPVTMVPYRTTRPFPISENYTVPRWSLVIPTFVTSLLDPNVYPEPESFQPERWLDPESTANKNPKNYLVYGNGPHKCIGIEYANMNIALVLATAVCMMDFEHDVTPLSEEIDIIATIFPKDGCRLTLTPRDNSA
ncbi:cytochrome P450 [Crepidotus variabilis]|uniref:sterol 22-desaturase n=1 Tax=Crepidotus variabilis TaxID=179855 RepID=A0A9P6E6U4_9AGAR|nr:cytochrome P450 [Crepidotus variabilis]